MKTLVPLLAMLATPVAAQDDGVLQGAYTLSAPTEATTGLNLSYDRARQELTFTSANEVVSALPDRGEVAFTIVFLDNGNEPYDVGWTTRRFSYERDGPLVRFSLRIAGEKNARQFLDDLANSRRLGLLEKGEVVIDYDLAGIDPAVSRLRACALGAARGSA